LGLAEDLVGLNGQRDGIKAFADDRSSQLVHPNKDLLFKARSSKCTFEVNRPLPTAAGILHECASRTG